MGAGYRMKISSKGQVVIPKKIRERLGLQAGDELSFQLLNDSTVAAEKVEATSFEIAMARIRRHLDELGVTEADLEQALEEVKHDLYEERYGSYERTQAVS